MLMYATPHMPRSSSPLNPTHRSSSPVSILSSPTPSSSVPLSLSFGDSLASSSACSNWQLANPNHNTHPNPNPNPNPHYSQPPSSPATPRPLSARYARTTPSSSLASRRPAAVARASSSSSAPIPADVFGEGTTPTQGAMWRDRLARRMADRERRRNARQADLARRRGTDEVDVDEDEAERRAQADDEEIFRRLMVLQRRRDQHAALYAHEQETGGSDPDLPDFWADELDVAREEQELVLRIRASDTGAYVDTYGSPGPSRYHGQYTPEFHTPARAHVDSPYVDSRSYVDLDASADAEAEAWARLAAEAEAEEAAREAALDAEDAALAERVEWEMARDVGMDEDGDYFDPEWDALDERMDVE